LVIGSSLKVAPVTDVVHELPHSTPRILINNERIGLNFDVELIGNCDVVVDWLQNGGVDPERVAGYDNVYLFEGGHRPPPPLSLQRGVRSEIGTAALDSTTWWESEASDDDSDMGWESHSSVVDDDEDSTEEDSQDDQSEGNQVPMN